MRAGWKCALCRKNVKRTPFPGYAYGWCPHCLAPRLLQDRGYKPRAPWKLAR